MNFYKNGLPIYVYDGRAMRKRIRIKELTGFFQGENNE